MAFLEPVLGRADIDLVLRSGSSGELLQALEALNLDVVLINQAPVHDALNSFIAHRLAEQPVSLVEAPARLRKTAEPMALLQAHPVILPSAGSSIRSSFDALADRLGIKPQIAAEVEDMAMMRLLAREDVSLAVLPPIVVKDELASGVLTEADHLPGIFETFYAITVTRRFPHPLPPSLLKAQLRHVRSTPQSMRSA